MFVILAWGEETNLIMEVIPPPPHTHTHSIVHTINYKDGQTSSDMSTSTAEQSSSQQYALYKNYYTVTVVSSSPAAGFCHFLRWAQCWAPGLPGVALRDLESFSALAHRSKEVARVYKLTNKLTSCEHTVSRCSRSFSLHLAMAGRISTLSPGASRECTKRGSIVRFQIC